MFEMLTRGGCRAFGALVGWSDLAAARSDLSKKAKMRQKSFSSGFDWRLALKGRQKETVRMGCKTRLTLIE